MIYSIGHSNHRLEQFVALLQQHGIKVLADVRSVPFPRHAPAFNRRSLEHSLPAAGVEYLYLGQELGGRPESPEFYDADGHALYSLMAAAPEFLDGIQQLLGQQEPTAVMCAEEDPAHCHRWLLIGRVFAGRGVEIRHVRKDGRLEGPPPAQAALLDDQWRSAPPVVGARGPAGR